MVGGYIRAAKGQAGTSLQSMEFVGPCICCIQGLGRLEADLDDTVIVSRLRRMALVESYCEIALCAEIV